MTRAVRRLVVVLAVMVACAATTSVAAAEVWTQMTPPVNPDIPELFGVGASSPSDVWAVGEQDADFSTPVAEHWNGTAWTEMFPGPDVPFQGGLMDVSALSATDAWAVGWQDTPGSGAVLAAFWNGSSWSVVPTPAPAGGSGVYLDSVSMLTPSDVWAVGDQSGRALAEHWNGTRWSVVPTPGRGPLVSVKAVSASNVWAIGQRHVVEHFNGTKWTTVAVPITSTTNLGQITRVPGTTHLWVVGTDMATRKPVAIYYNGTSWKAHDPPGAGAVLDGVAALSANDVWASGTSLTAPRNVTFHWTGSAWHAVAPAGLANGAVESVTRVPGSTQLWAVGMGLSSDGNSGGPFAAYYH